MSNTAGDRYDLEAANIMDRAGVTGQAPTLANLQDFIAEAIRQAASQERLTLASALRKFSPDLAHELTRRWTEAGTATEDFARFLRTVKP